MDNNNMDLREIGWGGMDWVDLVSDSDQCWALVDTVMNYRIPQNFGKFLKSLWLLENSGSWSYIVSWLVRRWKRLCS
jgi:hypothetical protein